MPILPKKPTLVTQVPAKPSPDVVKPPQKPPGTQPKASPAPKAAKPAAPAEAKDDLYRRHRPDTFAEVVGQTAAVTQLQELMAAGETPHGLLLVGPSGTGKTTLARIVARDLGCHRHDLQEINCASARGIDTVREMAQRYRASPIAGPVKVYILDEIQKTTGEFQSALLKILEECPKTCYFMLATTDPHKLLPTIRTRCATVKCEPVPYQDLLDLVKAVGNKEGVLVPDDAAEALAEAADGSARQALVGLQQVMRLPAAQMADAVVRSGTKKVAFDLIEAMMPFKGSPSWAGVAAVLDKLDDDPEALRRLVMGVARGALMKGGPRAAKANQVIRTFQYMIQDGGETAKAVLAHYCYEVVHSK